MSPYLSDSRTVIGENMARINLISIENMNKEQLKQYRRFSANLTRGLLCTANSTSAYLSLGASFRDARLGEKLRELIILRVAASSGSAYERMQHLPVARSVGWSDSDIAEIENGNGEPLGADIAVLLNFVDECIQSVRVSDTTFDALAKIYSEQEIAEIILLVGHYMMTARFVETLDIDMDEFATSWETIKEYSEDNA